MQVNDFSQRDGWIWMDGTFVPWRSAKIHVLTHTFHYGLGVFEGVRAYATKNGPAIFRLAEHTARLIDSARIVGMPMPFSYEELFEAQKEIVNKNELKSAYIRPMCYYGSEGMGLHAKQLKTHVMIAGWEWDSYHGGEALKHGIRMKTSSFRKPDGSSTFNRAKTNGNYVLAILATNQATQDGYDEALLLDSNGNPAEGSGENLFMVKNNTLYTPYLISALDGITRDTVIAIAKHLDIPVFEKLITLDELYVADEVFLTGTASEVVPVKELDNRIIAKGLPGTITKNIQKEYNDITHGRHSHLKDWNALCRQADEQNVKEQNG